MRRWRAIPVHFAAMLAVAALIGSGCRPREDAQPEQSYPAVAPLPSGPDDPLDRRAIAPVPAGYPITDLEFVDADEGYGLFQRCDQPRACQVALAVTLDGGNSWLVRALPFTPQNRVALRVGPGHLLLLRAEPTGWFVSRDYGRSFEQRPLQPPPLEVNLTGPKFVHRCPVSNPACTAPRPIIEIGPDGTETVLRAMPPVGDVVSLQLGGNGRLWAAGTQGADVLVAVSADAGRSWTPAGVITLGRTLATPPMLAVSDSGADVWLAGDGYGYRRAPDGHWTPVPAMKDATDLKSALALGDNVLLLAGTRGASTVTRDAWVPDAPPEVSTVRDLGDGVIQGYVVSGSADTVWLCRCHGTSRQWIRVAVSTP